MSLKRLLHQSINLKLALLKSLLKALCMDLSQSLKVFLRMIDLEILINQIYQKISMNLLKALYMDLK